MSQALTDAQLLTIWERGLALGPTERALLTLCVADPELQAAEVRAWPLGRRDATLLDVRDATFRQGARFLTQCPHCREQVEFELGADEMRRGTSAQASISIELDGLSIVARAPSSEDALLAERTTSAEEAADLLWHRCVQVSTRGGSPLPLAELDSAARARIESLLDEADPQTDLACGLKCAACGNGWVAPCDVARLLWDEIAAAAREVFDQIAALARAFGWTETQSLRLSRRRRQLYREMLE